MNFKRSKDVLDTLRAGDVVERVRGENRVFLKSSVAEAGSAFVDAGLISAAGLEKTLSEMQDAIDDPNVVVLAPRMSLVWARKAAPTLRRVAGTESPS